MATLAEVVESYDAYKTWTVQRVDEDQGADLRLDLLDIAAEFLSQSDALRHWAGNCKIKIEELGDHFRIYIPCFHNAGMEWVRVG